MSDVKLTTVNVNPADVASRVPTVSTAVPSSNSSATVSPVSSSTAQPAFATAHAQPGAGVVKPSATSPSTSSNATSAPPRAAITPQELKKQETAVQGAIKQLNDYVQSTRRDLHFSVDKSTGKTVITVIDQQTQKVVRQIPGELALKLAQSLQQEEPLSLFKVKA
ncbi:flagellar protein FlaG [Mangrovitalea sediminis]|uniref:flagellar protein FlaG n=1 Tax=Mangrovitalea sediminis TaxID=1982043 RepID=UPI000BE4E5BC|nr:flagellar protein FlaG [Mangrovitalea sediminis]